MANGKTTKKKVVKKSAAKSAAKKKSAPKVAAGLGIEAMAERLKVGNATARLRLRNAGVERPGKSYNWETRAALEADAKKVEATEATA